MQTSALGQVRSGGGSTSPISNRFSRSTWASSAFRRSCQIPATETTVRKPKNPQAPRPAPNASISATIGDMNAPRVSSAPAADDVVRVGVVHDRLGVTALGQFLGPGAAGEVRAGEDRAADDRG